MSLKIIKQKEVVFTLVCLKLKPKYYVNVTKTKTAARKDFGNFKLGPRPPTACRPLL